MQRERNWFLKCSYVHQFFHVLTKGTPSRALSLWKIDSYEGSAFIPDEISWCFSLYPSPEKDSSTWAGRFDFTVKMDFWKLENWDPV